MTGMEPNFARSSTSCCTANVRILTPSRWREYARRILHRFARPMEVVGRKQPVPPKPVDAHLKRYACAWSFLEDHTERLAL